MIAAAPEPSQLLWQNLSKTSNQRRSRSFPVHIILFFTLCLAMLPIAYISTFANNNSSETIWVALGTFLPQSLLAAFMALLSAFLLFISRKEGASSESHAAVCAIWKNFYFVVFNVFLWFIAWGAFVDPPMDQMMSLIGLGLARTSTFFITFIAFRFFVFNGPEISRLIPLIAFHFKKALICSEAEVRAAWAPADLGYAARVIPNDLLIITIVLCFSTAAPLIDSIWRLIFRPRMDRREESDTESLHSEAREQW